MGSEAALAIDGRRGVGVALAVGAQQAYSVHSRPRPRADPDLLVDPLQHALVGDAVRRLEGQADGVG